MRLFGWLDWRLDFITRHLIFPASEEWNMSALCRPRHLSICLLFLFASSVALAQAPAVKKRPKAADNDTVTPVPRKDAGWMQRQEKMNAEVAKGGVELLMIGDSITHAWEYGGSKVWQKYYGNRHAVNLGIGGDRTQHVLWRLGHGNLDGIHPKLAVLMIGTNNSGSNTPDQIAAGVRAIVQNLRSATPTTKVLVLAIFPRGPNPEFPQRKVNEAANERIAKLADNEHVFYLDINKKFLTADGTLTKDIMPDFLHPNAKGYEIWASAMEPTVARLLAEKE
jgi:lysophospholipase L1-like esterase